MMTDSNSRIGLVLKGAAMGIAEVVPGVSGGTIAFITGIYETLIGSIKSIGPGALAGWREGGLKGLWLAVNGDFLLWLLIGMVVGILCGVIGVDYLLTHFPEPLWSFFFGLILASAIYIGRQIPHWKLSTILAVVVGAVGAYVLTTLSPATGSLHPGYVFLSGVIAISALMLPGISGSFILLIMGMYTVIIPLVKDILGLTDLSGLSTIVIFACGCLTGMVLFSRVLSWLFSSYYQLTMAVMTGFLIGALNKVWPWRNTTALLDKNTQQIHNIADAEQLSTFDPEQIKLLTETNVLPAQYWGDAPMVVACIASFVLGLLLVLVLSKLDKS